VADPAFECSHGVLGSNGLAADLVGNLEAEEHVLGSCWQRLGRCTSCMQQSLARTTGRRASAPICSSKALLEDHQPAMLEREQTLLLPSSRASAETVLWLLSFHAGRPTDRAGALIKSGKPRLQPCRDKAHFNSDRLPSHRLQRFSTRLESTRIQIVQHLKSLFLMTFVHKYKMFYVQIHYHA